MNFCRHCGAKIASADDMFCANCGGNLQPDAPAQNEAKQNEQQSENVLNQKQSLQQAETGVVSSAQKQTMPQPLTQNLQQPSVFETNSRETPIFTPPVENRLSQQIFSEANGEKSISSPSRLAEEKINTTAEFALPKQTIENDPFVKPAAVSSNFSSTSAKQKTENQKVQPPSNKANLFEEAPAALFEEPSFSSETAAVPQNAPLNGKKTDLFDEAAPTSLFEEPNTKQAPLFDIEKTNTAEFGGTIFSNSNENEKTNWQDLKTLINDTDEQPVLFEDSKLETQPLFEKEQSEKPLLFDDSLGSGSASVPKQPSNETPPLFQDDSLNQDDNKADNASNHKGFSKNKHLFEAPAKSSHKQSTDSANDKNHKLSQTEEPQIQKPTPAAAPQKSKIQKIQMAADIASANNDEAVVPNANHGFSAMPPENNQPKIAKQIQNPPKPRLPEQPPQRKYEPKPLKQKRRSSGLASKLLTSVLIIILVVVITAVAVVGMLFFLNRPAAIINNFVTSISEKDISKLEKTVELDGITPSPEGWASLCAAFEEPQTAAQLKKELNEGTNIAFSAITLESEDFILFIKKYHVKLTGVEVLVPNATAQTPLTLGLTSLLDGIETEEGMLYNGILPGLYNYSYGEYSGSASLFSVDEANILAMQEDGAAPTGEATVGLVTVENCVSDAADIFVDGVLRDEKPVNAVVTLADVEIGATISISAKKDNKLFEASVVFSDVAVQALNFDNYSETADETASSSSLSSSTSSQTQAPSADELNNTISTFYKSYLECINAQKLDTIQLATDSYKSSLTSRISSPANKENEFGFESAVCKYDSVKMSEANGLKTATFSATFNYSYQKRGDASAAKEKGSNTQTVTLVYVNDAWLVSNLAFA